MPIAHWIAFAALSAGTVAFWPTLAADSFEELHGRELSTNPSDLRFVLLITNGQSRFHPGETIPITLEFSSDTADKYKLDAATYDRGGRLWSEEFVVDREVADPLADYFGSGVMGEITGGIRGVPVLGREPVAIKLRLNDWFRFDRPGRYRMFLKSHRLTRERMASEPGEGLVQFTAVSNVIEVWISEPDPNWEAEKLRELRAVFEPRARAEQEARNVLTWAPPDERILEAQQELGYLGTTDAVRLLFSLARDNVNNLKMCGLIRSPHRAFVIAELDRYVEDPNTVFGEQDIRTRTLFDFVQRHPKPFVPTTRAGLLNFDWNSVRSEAEKRQQEFDQMMRERVVRLIPVATRKSAAVREECVQTLAALAPEEAKAAGLIPPEDYGMTPSELRAGFSRFSSERQYELLTDKWGLVRGPEMLPALRQIVAGAAEKTWPLTTDTYALWHGPGNLAEVALDRLGDFAPEEARRVLLEDITRMEPRFAAMALDELPAQDIPKADAAIVANLKTKFSAVFPLAAKFATRQLLEPIRQAYDRRVRACMEEELFVAYMVRVDAEKGTDALVRAMADRKNRGCFHWLLSGVAHIVWNSVVERQAIVTLKDDVDGQAAGDAATALAAHAGPEVENLLWHRLERWSEEWRGRARELERHPITGADPHMADRLPGEAFINAISRASARDVDSDRARRLAALCVDDGCREQWMKHASPIDRKSTRLN